MSLTPAMNRGANENGRLTPAMNRGANENGRLTPVMNRRANENGLTPAMNRGANENGAMNLGSPRNHSVRQRVGQRIHVDLSGVEDLIPAAAATGGVGLRRVIEPLGRIDHDEAPFDLQAQQIWPTADLPWLEALDGVNASENSMVCGQTLQFQIGKKALDFGPKTSVPCDTAATR